MAKTVTYTPLTLTHPGESLQEFMEENNITSKELAARTGISEKHLSEILNGKSAITIDFALSLEEIFGLPAKFWINLQKDYDEALARKRREQALEEAKDWARNFPYAELSKLGIVKQTRKAIERVEELLNFFKTKNKQAWETVYLQQYPVAFKTTRTAQNQTNVYALTAWLRLGEMQAEQINAPEFDAKKLKDLLPEFKRLLNSEAQWAEVQKLALEAGLKVVFIPKLKGISITGATRWYRGYPVIMLSDLYKRYDLIWFAFFHELGHILLHGKREIFLEFKDEQADNIQEQEANRFAENQLITRKTFEQITIELNKNGYSDELIRNLSAQFDTHPAIIVGRLWHYRIIPNTLGQTFMKKVEFNV